MGTIDTLKSLFDPRRFQRPGAMSAHPDEGSSSESLPSAAPRRRGIEVSPRTKLVLFATTAISLLAVGIGYDVAPSIIDTYRFNLNRLQRGEITLDELQNPLVSPGGMQIDESTSIQPHTFSPSNNGYLSPETQFDTQTSYTIKQGDYAHMAILKLVGSISLHPDVQIQYIPIYGGEPFVMSAAKLNDYFAQRDENQVQLHYVHEGDVFRLATFGADMQ